MGSAIFAGPPITLTTDASPTLAFWTRYGIETGWDGGLVQVSSDDGATWADAQLEPALNAPFTWVRWAFPFEAVSGKFTMKIRVTDGQGAVMIEDEQAPLPDGATGWPTRTVEVGDDS